MFVWEYEKKFIFFFICYINLIKWREIKFMDVWDNKINV